jgi:hypothetical protein
LIVRNSVGEKNRDLNRKAVFIYHIAPVAAPPRNFLAGCGKETVPLKKFTFNKHPDIRAKSTFYSVFTDDPG